jgi:hypothetical protein
MGERKKQQGSNPIPMDRDAGSKLYVIESLEVSNSDVNLDDSSNCYCSRP